MLVAFGLLFLTGIGLVVLASTRRQERFVRIMIRRPLTLREVYAYGAFLLVAIAAMRIVPPGVLPRPLIFGIVGVLLVWTATFFRLSGPTFTAAAGIVSNQLVVFANGFGMPSHGLAQDLSVHSPVDAATRLAILGDIFPMFDAHGRIVGGFSLGDCVLTVGVWWIAARLWTGGRT